MANRRRVGARNVRAEGSSDLRIAPVWRGFGRAGLFATTALCGALWTGAVDAEPAANALPTGGVVTAGQSAIAANGNQMTITQGTQRSAINWNAYNIGSAAGVTYIQPNAQAISLNRVVGNDPSQIFGRLTANGQVWLSNPNGILFGRTARVDVAGLVAATSNISDSAFMAGGSLLHFDQAGRPDAAVVNEGEISIRDAGLAAFVAPGVRNSGTINARLGRVALGGGSTFTLDLYGDQLVNLQLPATQNAVAADGSAVEAGVTQSGRIMADGGRIQLSANVARGVVDNVVRMSGELVARGVSVDQNGDIVLDGGNAGTVEVTGTIDATAPAAGQRGGRVRVLGERIRIAPTVTIDVSGDAGGGTILVGGNWQGQGPERNAQATRVEAGARLVADALTVGRGGTVVVWSDGDTVFDGAISVRGGALGGDGGRAETSGHTLSIAGTASVDLAAASGQGGIWLLDPVTLEVIGTAGTCGSLPCGAGAQTVQNTVVIAALVGGDVTLSATTSILVNAGIAWTANNNALTLTAPTVTINQAVAGAGNSGTDLIINATTLNLNNDISAAGGISGTATTVNINALTAARFQDALDASTNAAGTLISFNAGASAISVGSALNSGNRSLALITTSTIGINEDIAAGAGTVTLSSGGNITQGSNDTITANTLIVTTTNGSATLTESNAITNLGAVTIGGAGNDFQLNDTGGLTVTGAVSAPDLVAIDTSGTLTVNAAITAGRINLDTSSNGNITVGAALTAGGAGTSNNVIDIDSSGGVTVNAALAVGGAGSSNGTVTIVADVSITTNASGTITVGGAGSTNSNLTITAGTDGSGNLSIGGAINVFGSTVTLQAPDHLTVGAAIDAPDNNSTINLLADTNNDGSGTLQIDAAVTASAAGTGGTVNLQGANLVISASGSVTASALIYLRSTGGTDINIGGSGGVEISADEFERLNAPHLRFDADDDFNLNADIGPGGAGEATPQSRVTQLTFEADDDVTITTNNTIAWALAGATLNLVAGDLVTVDATVTLSGLNSTVNITAANVAINQNVTAGALVHVTGTTDNVGIGTTAETMDIESAEFGRLIAPHVRVSAADSDGDVVVGGAFTINGAVTTITFTGGDDVRINSGVTWNTAAATLNLNATDDVVTTAAIALGGGAAVLNATAGGDVTVGDSSGDTIVVGQVGVAGSQINLTAGNLIDVNAALTANGSTINMLANNGVTVDANATAVGANSLIRINADNDGNGSGNVVVNDAVLSATAAGSVIHITYGGDFDTNGTASINVHAADTTGYILIDRSNGGQVTVGSSGQIDNNDLGRLSGALVRIQSNTSNGFSPSDNPGVLVEGATQSTATIGRLQLEANTDDSVEFRGSNSFTTRLVAIADENVALDTNATVTANSILFSSNSRYNAATGQIDTDVVQGSVILSSGALVIANSGGTIQFISRATAAGDDGVEGIVMGNGAQVRTTGDIELRSNRIDITGNASTQVGGSGAGAGQAANVFIGPFTAGTAISVNGAAVHDLTTDELSRIRAVNVTVGNYAASGLIAANTATTTVQLNAWTNAAPATFATGVLTFRGDGTVTVGGNFDRAGAATSSLVLESQNAGIALGGNLNTAAYQGDVFLIADGNGSTGTAGDITRTAGTIFASLLSTVAGDQIGGPGAPIVFQATGSELFINAGGAANFDLLGILDTTVAGTAGGSITITSAPRVIVGTVLAVNGLVAGGDVSIDVNGAGRTLQIQQQINANAGASNVHIEANGGIGQSVPDGVITANTLTVTTQNGSASLTAQNVLTNLGAVSIAGTNSLITLTDVGGLTVTGAVNVTGNIRIQTTGTFNINSAITSTGGDGSSPGRIFLSALPAGDRDLNIGANITTTLPGGAVRLTAADDIIQTNGAAVVATSTLTMVASGDIGVGGAGAIQYAPNGSALLLSSGGSAFVNVTGTNTTTVAGSVGGQLGLTSNPSIIVGSVTDPITSLGTDGITAGGAVSIDVNGAGNTLDLQRNLNAGAFSVHLEANAGITQNAATSVVTAGTLTVTTQDGSANLDGSNAITTLGAVSVVGANAVFELVDIGGLTVTGPVTAARAILIDTSGGNLTINGPITATQVGLPARAILLRALGAGSDVVINSATANINAGDGNVFIGAGDDIRQTNSTPSITASLLRLDAVNNVGVATDGGESSSAIRFTPSASELIISAGGNAAVAILGGLTTTVAGVAGGTINIQAQPSLIIGQVFDPFFFVNFVGLTTTGVGAAGQVTINDSNGGGSSLTVNEAINAVNGRIAITNFSVVNLNNDLNAAANAATITGNIRTINVQNDSTAQIQDGVFIGDDSTSTVVNVVAGVFEENVLIDRTLNLRGAQHNVVAPWTNVPDAGSRYRTTVADETSIVGTGAAAPIIRIQNGTNTANDVVISGVRIARSGAGQDGVSIQTGRTGITIQYSILEGGGSATANGIVFENSARGTVRYNDISDWASGVVIGSNGSSSVQVLQNYIHDNTLAGITLNAGARYDIQENFIWDNGVGNAGGAGILFAAAPSGSGTRTIEENSFEGNVAAGNAGVAIRSLVDTFTPQLGENWWGSLSGPTHPSNVFNVGSQGQQIVGLTSIGLAGGWYMDGTDQEVNPPDSLPGAIGWQGNGSSLGPIRTFDALGNTTGIFATWNQAVASLTFPQAQFFTSVGIEPVAFLDGIHHTFTENVVVDRTGLFSFVQLRGRPGEFTHMTATSGNVFTITTNNVTIGGGDSLLIFGTPRGFDINGSGGAVNGVVVSNSANRTGVNVVNNTISGLTGNGVQLGTGGPGTIGTVLISTNTIDVGGWAVDIGVPGTGTGLGGMLVTLNALAGGTGGLNIHGLASGEVTVTLNPTILGTGPDSVGVRIADISGTADITVVANALISGAAFGAEIDNVSGGNVTVATNLVVGGLDTEVGVGITDTSGGQIDIDGNIKILSSLVDGIGVLIDNTTGGTVNVTNNLAIDPAFGMVIDNTVAGAINVTGNLLITGLIGGIAIDNTSGGAITIATNTAITGGVFGIGINDTSGGAIVVDGNTAITGIAGAGVTVTGTTSIGGGPGDATLIAITDNDLILGGLAGVSILGTVNAVNFAPFSGTAILVGGNDLITGGVVGVSVAGTINALNGPLSGTFIGIVDNGAILGVLGAGVSIAGTVNALNGPAGGTAILVADNGSIAGLLAGVSVIGTVNAGNAPFGGTFIGIVDNDLIAGIDGVSILGTLNLANLPFGGTGILVAGNTIAGIDAGVRIAGTVSLLDGPFGGTAIGVLGNTILGAVRGVAVEGTISALNAPLGGSVIAIGFNQIGALGIGVDIVGTVSAVNAPGGGSIIAVFDNDIVGGVAGVSITGTVSALNAPLGGSIIAVVDNEIFGGLVGVSVAGTLSLLDAPLGGSVIAIADNTISSLGVGVSILGTFSAFTPPLGGSIIAVLDNDITAGLVGVSIAATASVQFLPLGGPLVLVEGNTIVGGVIGVNVLETVGLGGFPIVAIVNNDSITGVLGAGVAIENTTSAGVFVNGNTSIVGGLFGVVGTNTTDSVITVDGNGFIGGTLGGVIFNDTDPSFVSVSNNFLIASAGVAVGFNNTVDSVVEINNNGFIVGGLIGVGLNDTVNSSVEIMFNGQGVGPLGGIAGGIAGIAINNTHGASDIHVEFNRNIAGLGTGIVINNTDQGSFIEVFANDVILGGLTGIAVNDTDDATIEITENSLIGALGSAILVNDTDNASTILVEGNTAILGGIDGVTINNTHGASRVTIQDNDAIVGVLGAGILINNTDQDSGVRVRFNGFIGGLIAGVAVNDTDNGGLVNIHHNVLIAGGGAGVAVNETGAGGEVNVVTDTNIVGLVTGVLVNNTHGGAVNVTVDPTGTITGLGVGVAVNNTDQDGAVAIAVNNDGTDRGTIQGIVAAVAINDTDNGGSVDLANSGLVQGAIAGVVINETGLDGTVTVTNAGTNGLLAEIQSFGVGVAVNNTHGGTVDILGSVDATPGSANSIHAGTVGVAVNNTDQDGTVTVSGHQLIEGDEIGALINDTDNGGTVALTGNTLVTSLGVGVVVSGTDGDPGPATLGTVNVTDNTLINGDVIGVVINGTGEGGTVNVLSTVAGAQSIQSLVGDGVIGGIGVQINDTEGGTINVAGTPGGLQKITAAGVGSIGIQTNNTAGGTINIASNDIDPDIGIQVVDAFGGVHNITGNTIVAGVNGIWLVNSDATPAGTAGVAIAGNTITFGQNGAGGFGIGVFTGTPAGNVPDPTAMGFFNVTIGFGNTITGSGVASVSVTPADPTFEVGLLFDGPNSAIVGNTLNNLVFNTIDGNYITFQNFALYVPGQPTIINAEQVSFDGQIVGLLPPSLARNALIADIEARITDFDDNTGGDPFTNPTFVGQIFLGDIFVPASIFPTFDRIVVDGPFAFSADPFSVNQTIGGGGGGTGGGAGGLQNIAPAAGGQTAEELNQVNPAAGPGGATQCAAAPAEDIANDLLGSFSFGDVTQFADQTQQCAQRVEQQRAAVQ